MNMSSMGLPLEMKRLEGRTRAYQNFAFQAIMKFENLKNGGTAIQWGSLNAMKEIL